MTTPDPVAYPPSVGELLNRADVLVRSLSYEALYRDGRSLLRGWREAVKGATELWRVLPQRSDIPGHGASVMDQLYRAARTMYRDVRHNAVAVDPTLEEVGQVFARAAGSIRRSGVHERRDPDRWTDAQLRDAFAARVQIMHILYVGTHATAMGLSTTAQAEGQDERLRVHRVPAQELRQRMLDLEQLAHSYIKGNYPQALAGEHREPPDESRVPSAIATWDVYVHRALTKDPTAAVMTRVAGGAVFVADQAQHLWWDAVRAGRLDRDRFDQEVGPGLEAAAGAWQTAQEFFDQLQHRNDKPPRNLTDAGWGLVAGLQEVAGSPPGAAPPREAGDQVAWPTLARSLQSLHATLAGIAGAFDDATRTAPLLVDSRAANRLARPGSGGLEAVVTARDVYYKRAVPLPVELRSRATEVAGEVVRASRASLRTVLSATDHSPALTPAPAVGSHLGQVERLVRSVQLERRGPAAGGVHLGGGPRR